MTNPALGLELLETMVLGSGSPLLSVVGPGAVPPVVGIDYFPFCGQQNVNREPRCPAIDCFL